MSVSSSGVVLKNEVGERLEIEVETVAKSAILQDFCIVWAQLFLKLLNVKNYKKINKCNYVNLYIGICYL